MKRLKKIPLLEKLLLLFFSVLMLCGTLMIYLNNIDNKLSKEKLPEQDLSGKFADNMILNILLVGLDELKENFRGRSDCMMILTLDLRHKKIKVTSLMRDLWVNIPKYGKGKLNWAYPKGGVSLLAKTIKSEFGVAVDGYAIIDFNKFENIIDELGGIDLSLTPNEVKFINNHSKDKNLFGSGLMHLNGNQALQFVRDRDDPDADFKRTERQRTLINTIIQKFKSKFSNDRGALLELVSFSKNVFDMIETNFNIKQIMSLSKLSKKFISYPVITYRIPDNFKSGFENGHSVLYSLDNKNILVDFIYENNKNNDIF